MKSDKILQNLLKNINKYLKMSDVSEIILNQVGIVRLDTIKGFKEIKDDNITYDFLNDLPKQIATHSEQHFNEKFVVLSSNIPGTNYRITAVNSSCLQSSYNSILIRKSLGIEFTLKDYTDNKDYIDLLENLAINGKNILIVGGTGTGKTSLINQLIKYIPLEQRIVTIQDSAELIIPHKNKDELIVSKNGSNASKLDYKMGLDITMRLRPDRILLGEIDSVNTLAFLRLGNTGHKGMISTLHTDSPEDTLNALRLNLLLGGFSASDDTLNSFIESAIDYVVKIERFGSKKKVTAIKTIKEIIKESEK